jgi:hypothetical protein
LARNTNKARDQVMHRSRPARAGNDAHCA